MALEFLDSDEFKAELIYKLKNLPTSPSPEDTSFFERIILPYNLLQNLQYSNALEAWEKIFMLINEIDEKRFPKIHKGTPYYFCGIAAFMMKDYERAVFYMDAAFAEDFKNYGIFNLDPKTAPAALFLTLDAEKQGQSAKPLVEKTRNYMEKAFEKFNNESGEEMTLAQLRDSFLSPSTDKDKSPAWRTAVTALISFLLESDSRKMEFSLRSDHGGTQEPFFLHLFKGCLLFETLLKLSLQCKECENQKCRKGTLDKVLKKPAIQGALGINEHAERLSKEVGYITFDKIVEINNSWRGREKFHDRVVWTTYGVRNTTGHNLSWETNMTPEDFNNLSDDILFAIFLVLQKLF